MHIKFTSFKLNTNQNLQWFWKSISTSKLLFPANFFSPFQQKHKHKINIFHKKNEIKTIAKEKENNIQDNQTYNIKNQETQTFNLIDLLKEIEWKYL